LRHLSLYHIADTLPYLLSLLFFFLILPRPPRSTLFPYTTLFRSQVIRLIKELTDQFDTAVLFISSSLPMVREASSRTLVIDRGRSEEHTSELQSRFDLVCRLLLEKKKIITDAIKSPTDFTYDYVL